MRTYRRGISDEGVEGEGSVALLAGAGLGEEAAAVGERFSAAVFGDDEGVGGEDGAAWLTAQEAEGGGILGVEVPGRIEEDEVERGGGVAQQLVEECGGAFGIDVESGCDFESGQVGSDGGDGGGGFFGEGDVGGAAAEGLDSDGAGAGVKIGEAAAGNAGRDDVEEGLAEAVAGGAGEVAARGGERTGAVGAGDDAHSTIMTSWIEEASAYN